jgi:hypothetical protein
MMRALLTCSALIAVSAHADDVRVYQTDKYGHIQYSKPSLTIRADGRVIQTDAYGNKLYHKQQYQITGEKIVPVSAFGYRQYSKPALVIKGQ